MEVLRSVDADQRTVLGRALAGLISKITA